MIEGTKIAAPKGVTEEERKAFNLLNKRNNDSMLDQLAAACIPSEYIKNYGTNGKSPLTGVVYLNRCSYQELPSSDSHL